MRITVVGAISILIVVAAGILLILALRDRTKEIGSQQNDKPQQSPPLESNSVIWQGE